MNTDAQERNYSFFKANLESYLKDPLINGKYVIIFNEELKHIFDTFDAAIRYAVKNFPLGFIIQQIIDENKIVNFTRSVV